MREVLNNLVSPQKLLAAQRKNKAGDLEPMEILAPIDTFLVAMAAERLLEFRIACIPKTVEAHNVSQIRGLLADAAYRKAERPPVRHRGQGDGYGCFN